MLSSDEDDGLLGGEGEHGCHRSTSADGCDRRPFLSGLGERPIDLICRERRATRPVGQEDAELEPMVVASLAAVRALVRERVLAVEVLLHGERHTPLPVFDFFRDLPEKLSGAPT